MQLEGSISTTGPADEVVRGLADLETLGMVAPTGFTFRPNGPGAFDFTFRRAFGPISLTLQGTQTLTEVADGVHRLEIKAAHLIGGKVQVVMDITSGEGNDGLEQLAWTGMLTGQGLAGRLLAERAEDANRILRNLVVRLRDHVEVM